MASNNFMATNFSLIVLVSLLMNLCGGILLSDFYPYNNTYGDTQTPRIDDGGSDNIKLTKRFKFFGKNKTSVYVNNNGILTFENKLEEYKPQSFPSKENRSIIAPFWADVNTEHVGGTVWFRETLERDLLERASTEVCSYFRQQRRFTATWMLIATWEKVGYYGASREGKNKRNTFQSILITDEIDSFVIFNYNTIEWTTGSNSGGNSITGLGGNPAQVGFNAGDSIHYYSVEGAQTAAVINLTLTSNVDIPGKWVFQVDGDFVNDNTCKNETSPLLPNTVSRLNSQNLVEEGTNATFICYGNVEKPPGIYTWQTIRTDNASITHNNVTTITTESPELCTSNGSSFLTIEMSADDNQAIIRCAVQSMTTLYKDSEPVNVLYKVRKPTILKYPEQDFYLVGSNNITLTCSADGNPKSGYAWYKDQQSRHVLSLDASLVIYTMNVTNSGTYVCHAFNSFSTNTYNQYQSVDISIVHNISMSTPKATDKAFYEQPWLWIVVLIAVLLITTISVFVVRHYVTNKIKQYTAYSDIVETNVENRIYDTITPQHTSINDGYDDMGTHNHIHSNEFNLEK